jgi:uncharacterized protein YdeI (YjbR/CyaY-like superfamily)
MDAKFFPTPADFRKWFESNHDKETELLVGFYKKDTGKPSITWPESVDQALCFGWIDGIRKKIDEESYSIRFTPRKKSSIWSAVNIKRVSELTEHGLMKPSGLAVFEQRKKDKSAIYSYEQRDKAALEPDDEKQFKANKKAWEWFHAQAPSYQKAAIWWVVSAKQEATRQKRIASLIEDSENRLRIAFMRRPNDPK